MAPHVRWLLIGGIDITSPASGRSTTSRFSAPALQLVELLAEARQVYKRMRIGSLTRLQQVFRFVETRQESMCRKVQFHGGARHPV